MSKTKLIYSLFLAVFLAFISQLSSYSDGPPPARTGAPSELTCFNGYCHNSYQLNSGAGFSSLETDIPELGYAPGETYNIKLSVADSGMRRFGFQLLPYSPNQEEMLGELILSNPEETKLEEEQNRVYIMHDTAQAITDSAFWAFQWKAPTKGSGEVIFHWTFVAADSNGKRAGDYVYKSSREIAENLTASNQLLFSQNKDIRLINQLGRGIRLYSLDRYYPDLEVKVLDIQGRLLSQWKGDLGSEEVEILSGNRQKGIYVLVFRFEGKEWGRKVF